MVTKTPKRKRAPGGGRKPFHPTAEQRAMVRAAAGFGIDQDTICALVLTKAGTPVAKKTLAKHFSTELSAGKAEGKTKVAGAFFKNCMAGNLGAQIFYLKTQCGWKETQSVELTGKDGAELQGGAPSVTVYLPQKDALPAEAEAAGG